MSLDWNLRKKPKKPKSKMEKGQETGLREGQEVFCSYLEDNGIATQGYFYLLKITDSYVELKSQTNILILPISRILKIKQRWSQ